MSDWKLVSFGAASATAIRAHPTRSFMPGTSTMSCGLTRPRFSLTLVASDTSGVWLVSESGGIAMPLSWNWDSPHLNCLAPGFHSDQHVYAAGDALWETDTTTPFPLLNWRRIPIQTDGEHPLNPGQIYRVIVVRERRR